MALKIDRYIIGDRIDCFMNEVAAPGGIATISTVGSGVALDNSSQLVTYAADPSGTFPAGVLMQDMVNIDTTRQFLNTQKDEVQAGSKVTLVTNGWVVTDKVVGTAAAGAPAFVGPSGNFMTAAYEPTITKGDGYGGLGNSQQVGVFQTTADEDGYVRVSVFVTN